MRRFRSPAPTASVRFPSSTFIAYRKTPQTDTNLQPDELITAVELPALPFGAPLQVSQSARPRQLCVRACLGRCRARSRRRHDHAGTPGFGRRRALARFRRRKFSSARQREKTPSKRQQEELKVARGYQHKCIQDRTRQAHDDERADNVGVKEANEVKGREAGGHWPTFQPR